MNLTVKSKLLIVPIYMRNFKVAQVSYLFTHYLKATELVVGLMVWTFSILALLRFAHLSMNVNSLSVM